MAAPTARTIGLVTWETVRTWQDPREQVVIDRLQLHTSTGALRIQVLDGARVLRTYAVTYGSTLDGIANGWISLDPATRLELRPAWENLTGAQRDLFDELFYEDDHDFGDALAAAIRLG